MDNLEKNNFEEHWQKAFENASETPPDSIWARIEARLDEDEERVIVIPFWQRWQTWSVAASIAAVMMVGGAMWWKNKDAHTSKNQQIAVQQNNTNKIEDKEPASATTSQKNIADNQKELKSRDNLLNNQIGNVSLDKETEKSQKLAPNKIIEKGQLVSTTSPITRPAVIDYKNTKGLLGDILSKGTDKKIAQNTAQSPKIKLSSNILKEALENESVVFVPADKLISDEVASTATVPAFVINSLEGKPLKSLLGLQKRQPWVAYQPQNNPAEVKKTASKEYWASVGVMPSSYNAGVGIGGRAASNTFAFAGQDALARTAAYDSPTDKSNNRGLFSYAIQWQGGVQLAQRWSLETGLNYLQGNSEFVAVNGFNPLSNSYINNLEAAVNLSDNSQKSIAIGNVANNFEKAQIQSLYTSQAVNNAYQYLQVPLQAGFAVLKPKRKFSLWLLGGVINNLFLRNSFETGQERTVTVNGVDSPYRLLSLSASTGVRVQYKINKRWATTLTGNYQRSLGSITHANSLFEARPVLLGMGAGLRYRF